MELYNKEMKAYLYPIVKQVWLMSVVNYCLNRFGITLYKSLLLGQVVFISF